MKPLLGKITPTLSDPDHYGFRRSSGLSAHDFKQPVPVDWWIYGACAVIATLTAALVLLWP